MSDISQSSQATSSQALTKLSSVALTSEVGRQGADVLVKHLAGNVLSLSKNTALLNKSVLLNQPQIKGKLAEGQIHQIKLSLENNPSLIFFSPQSVKSTGVIALTEQQLQSLLRLPAKQLIPGHLIVKPNTKHKLPVMSATVLSVLPKEPPSDQVLADITKVNHTPTINQQNILKLSLTDQRPAVEVMLPVKQLKQFTAGQNVTLTIAPKGNDWQLTIVQNKTNVTLTDSRVNSSQDIRLSKDQHTVIPALLAIPIIKACLRTATQANPVNFELPIKPVLQQLSKINNRPNQLLIQKLQAMPIDKLFLQIQPSGAIDLLVQSTQPVASIPITKEIAQALAALKLPNQQALSQRLALTTDSSKLQTPVQVSPAPLNQNISKPSTPFIQNTTASTTLESGGSPQKGNQSDTTKLSIKQLAANLLEAVQHTPLTQSVINPSLLANKPQQINLLQQLLRIVQAKAEAPAIPLQSIDKAFADVDFFKEPAEHPSKQLIAQVLQQIKQALPQGKEQDVNQIRHILTTPAFNLSSLQMINPASSQGFMGGLVTLLHMSLGARLTRNQSSRAEHITSTLNTVLGGTSKVKPNVTTKAMGELSQLEQKHQLMKEIGRLLSGHQTSKLSNAEQMIQGQDTFYYNLPTLLSGTFKDIELLIKRENNNKENSSDDKTSTKTWQLTMKLAVGEMGELLTKAKLRSDTLDINFYASNETVKIQVMNYLPLLRRKLDSLGIKVNKSYCQLGKIPDTLQQRPYHMFQAKA